MDFDQERAKLYSVSVAGNRRSDTARTKFDLPSRQPHELAREKMEGDPTLTVRLLDAIAENTLPPSCAENPVVTGSHEPVIPYA